MAITEQQLITWSHTGAGAGSRDTYAAIKSALEDSRAPYAGREISVFLQGSYENDTNVWAESDVDVVIRTKAVYWFNNDALSLGERSIFDNQFVPATYHYTQFKDEVTNWLRKWFDADALPGNKAIEIAARPPRRKADVLITSEFRLYRPSVGGAPLGFEPGVRFVTQDGKVIVNHPEQHSANLTARHQQLRGRLKPTIRIFKNLRNRMVNDGIIAKGLAPSYFIEGMLYNVPGEMFGANNQSTVSYCLNWLWHVNMGTLICPNGIHLLIGDETTTSWPSANFAKFVTAANDFWGSWQ